MKNTPITARVKSGMFKTKEPLLNVGPAGVDGNNKTRTMPSPSKMKGYAMKSSPFKQTKTDNAADKALKKANLTFDGKGGAGGEIETTTTVKGDITKGKEITKTGNFDKTWDKKKAGGLSYAEWIKKDGNKAKEDKFIESKQEGTGKFEPDTVGPDKVVKTKVKGDTFRKSEGDAQTPYERRQALRGAKRIARAQKSEQRKTDRLDRKEGKTTKTKKQQRIDRKRTQIATNSAVADAEAKNVINQAEQNRSTTSTKSVTGADVKNTAADFDKNVQLENLDVEAPKKTGLFDQFKSPAPMKNTGFFKKKSPMKMNYFKK